MIFVVSAHFVEGFLGRYDVVDEVENYKTFTNDLDASIIALNRMPVYILLNKTNSIQINDNFLQILHIKQYDILLNKFLLFLINLYINLFFIFRRLLKLIIRKAILLKLVMDYGYKLLVLALFDESMHDYQAFNLENMIICVVLVDEVVYELFPFVCLLFGGSG